MPIAFISKSFQKGEINYSVIEKELFAIHYAVIKFRPYLYGKHFIVRSDHKALIHLYSSERPASKLARLRMDLEEFDFSIEHIRGQDNVVSNALSRIRLSDFREVFEENVENNPKEILAVTRSMSNKMKETKETGETNEEESIEIMNASEELASYNKKVPRVKTTNIDTDESGKIIAIELTVYQNHKKLFKLMVNGNIVLKTIFSQLHQATIKRKINKMQWPKNDDIFEICSLDDFKYACAHDLGNVEVVLIEPQTLITDKKEQLRLIKENHDNVLYGGHSGFKKLYSKLRQLYYWKGMTRDITKYIKECRQCMLKKHRPHIREEMVITQTPQKPFDLVIIDTVGKLPESKNGNFYLLTMICDLTKFLITIPMKTKSATEVADAIFKKFILNFGPMREMRSDCGTELHNEIVKELCKIFETKQIFSSPHHHQTVGTVERNHRELHSYLRMYLEDELDNWDINSDYFAFCYNISKNASNNFKYSPYELVYGRRPNLPKDLLSGNVAPLYNIDNHAKELKFILQKAHEKTRKILIKMKENNKAYYDRKTNVLDVNVGDKVLIRKMPMNKHGKFFLGPYDVVSIDNVNVEVKLDDKTTKVLHKNLVVKA